MALALALALMARAAASNGMVPAKGPQPLGNVSTWFSAKDYPQEALVKRQQGGVGFQLDIDPNGLPSDCHVIQSSGSKILDDRTCTIMMARSRFRPIAVAKPRKTRRGKVIKTKAIAMNPDGTPPPAAVFRHVMMWKLPGKQAEKLVDRSFDAKSEISATGDVTSCKLSGAGASKIATSGGGCGPFGNKDFFTFFLKDDYKRVHSTNVRMSIVSNGAPPPIGDKPPNFQKVIAKSDIDIAPDGSMAACTSTIKMEALGHTLDLCEFVRADPPRFPVATGPRKATIILDLSAFYS